jgi:hypothetical protein
MSKIIIVHGINTHGGSPNNRYTIDGLGRSLEKLGWEIVFLEFEKQHFYHYWNSRRIRQLGHLLHNAMNDGDHIICHSAGALLWHESITFGAKWGKCFVFGGAATSDSFPYPDDAFESADIFYNPEDKALLLGSLLPYHPFGKLGRKGYVGPKDKRIKNHAMLHSEFFNLEHSHYFDEFHQPRTYRHVSTTLGKPAQDSFVNSYPDNHNHD